MLAVWAEVAGAIMYLQPKAALARVLAPLIFIVAVSSFCVTARAESPFCSLPPDPAAPWLPVTPPPNETTVPAPRPASDCQFYRPAWQRFLVATQPDHGRPAFLGYPSFEDIFPPKGSPPVLLTSLRVSRVLNLAPRNIQVPNNPTPSQQKFLDNTQAGIDSDLGGYLIDQHGRFVYYAIHVNPAFLQFLQNQNLTTADGILGVDRCLTFLGPQEDLAAGVNTNVVEYKSAWMIVDSAHPPPNYFVVPAKVPHYIVSGNTLKQQGTDDVSVALLALHVVFTLPGHPELIWSTFEHVGPDKKGDLVRDNAPAAADNPINTPDDTKISDQNFPLYKANTTRAKANENIEVQGLSTIVQYWNSKTQSFVQKDGTAYQTSVYRPFPGSKTDASENRNIDDDEVAAMNSHATTMFKDAQSKHLLAPDDKRQYYRLVGAIWLDQPLSGASPSFDVGKHFAIKENQSTDDKGQPIAGEGRLGSTAMESFTEDDDAEPNCFSCHDTSNISGMPMKSARLNVSHVLSKYIKSLQGITAGPPPKDKSCFAPPD
jgi:hypothetical protein